MASAWFSLSDSEHTTKPPDSFWHRVFSFQNVHLHLVIWFILGSSETRCHCIRGSYRLSWIRFNTASSSQVSSSRCVLQIRFFHLGALSRLRDTDLCGDVPAVEILLIQISHWNYKLLSSPKLGLVLKCRNNAKHKKCKDFTEELKRIL